MFSSKLWTTCLFLLLLVSYAVATVSTVENANEEEAAESSPAVALANQGPEETTEIEKDAKIDENANADHSASVSENNLAAAAADDSQEEADDDGKKANASSAKGKKPARGPSFVKLGTAGVLGALALTNPTMMAVGASNVHGPLATHNNNTGGMHQSHVPRVPQVLPSNGSKFQDLDMFKAQHSSKSYRKNKKGRNLAESDVMIRNQLADNQREAKLAFYRSGKSVEEKNEEVKYVVAKDLLVENVVSEVAIPPVTDKRFDFLDNVEVSQFADMKAGTSTAPYGPLRLVNKKLSAELRGIALMVSNWYPTFWTEDVVTQLACKWNANVIRAAMGVDAGGYLTNPQQQWDLVTAVVDAAIKHGIYVVVDWHQVGDSAHPRSADYTNFINQGVKFFRAMSAKYPNVPNVLYELWNEPSRYKVGGNEVYLTWAEIKRYHVPVIQAIRANSPNAVIIYGTPGWSTGPKGDVLASPLQGTNLMATLHWYTVGEQENKNQQQAIDFALSKGISTFVTEYGTTGLNPKDPVEPTQVKEWWDFMDAVNRQVPYMNWEVSNKDEDTAALKPSCQANQVGVYACLTQSGLLVYNKLRQANKGVACYRPADSGPSKTYINRMQKKRKLAEKKKKQAAARRGHGRLF